jgi:chaperonin GroES
MGRRQQEPGSGPDGHLPAPGGYIQSMIRNDKELIVVGDRVLVKVDEGEERTHVGLYLPSTALDSQAVQGGTIMETGPGQPMPSFDAAVGDEPWKEPVRETRFVPMQARRGDYALFFRKASVEITFENERFLVVPQAAILALVRE